MSCATLRHESVPRGNVWPAMLGDSHSIVKEITPSRPLSDTTIYKIRRQSLTGLCDQVMGEAVRPDVFD